MIVPRSPSSVNKDGIATPETLREADGLRRWLRKRQGSSAASAPAVCGLRLSWRNCLDHCRRLCQPALGRRNVQTHENGANCLLSFFVINLPRKFPEAKKPRPVAIGGVASSNVTHDLIQSRALVAAAGRDYHLNLPELHPPRAPIRPPAKR